MLNAQLQSLDALEKIMARALILIGSLLAAILLLIRKSAITSEKEMQDSDTMLFVEPSDYIENTHDTICFR